MQRPDRSEASRHGGGRAPRFALGPDPVHEVVGRRVEWRPFAGGEETVIADEVAPIRLHGVAGSTALGRQPDEELLRLEGQLIGMAGEGEHGQGQCPK